MKLAPFDRFPESEKFPLSFRFSEAVAPAERSAAKNFENLSLTPARPGTWRWTSDSELQFTPLDPWKPEEKLQISLSNLVTSSRTKQTGPIPTPTNFQVTLPKAQVSLAYCELRVNNQAPLIQVPHIGLRFNYGLREFPKDFWDLKLARKEEMESLPIQTSPWSKGVLRLDLQGPKIFRPRSEGTISFELRKGLPVGTSAVLSEGLDCNIPIGPESWDSLSESLKNEGNKPQLAEIRIEEPQRYLNDPEGARRPLLVSFVAPWSDTKIPHGKAKGITLDQGISLTPEISGQWKASTGNHTELIFTPSIDWPVGQETTISIDPHVFPAIELRTSEQKFITPTLTAQFDTATLYTNPQNPDKRNVIATIDFSHQPNIDSLEKLMQAAVRVEPQKEFLSGLSFKVLPDEKSPFRIHIQTEEIPLRDDPAEVQLLLPAGLIAEAGGAPSRYSYNRRVAIPSRQDIFQIQTAVVNIVRKPDEELQRVLSIETSEPAQEDEFATGIRLYLLPDCKLKDNKKACRNRDSFGHESVVFPDTLTQASQLKLTPLPADEKTSPNMFHFSFEAPGSRQLLLVADTTLASKTGFSLRKDFRSVLFVEDFPRQLKILHDGSLLSLSGNKELGISLRNITDVQFELARVLPHDVHHLVSVNQGSFANPNFDYSSLGLNQFAETLRYKARYPMRDPGHTTYAAVDFNRFTKNGQVPQGMFILTVREFKKGEDEEQQRER
ncbi:MAG: hypothetical protein KDD62_01460, partial [Bdellovibrionales bacterium]|nr:hypothetical protein [Bdellovibrionales bacterium]